MQEPIDHRVNSTAVTQSEFNAQQIRFLPAIIEFVRKRFVYDKLQYNEIEEIELKTGYLIKNRWVIRAIAIMVIILLIRFIFYIVDHTNNLIDTNPSFWFNKGSMIAVWGPIVLIVGALLAFYQSFLRSTVVTIKTEKFTRRISVRKLDKIGDTDKLIPFLKSRGVLVFDKRDRP